MKQLSIIIVNYKVAHFLALCLDSVFAATINMDAEVIVVDNASDDGSCDMVRTKYPETILLANKNNVGFAVANNQGVAKATGEYICILNPDTVVGESVFENVYAFAKANSHIGAIGVRLVDGTGGFLPECKRNLPTPKVAFEKLFGAGDTYYARNIQLDQNGHIDILVGAFMFMQKTVYEEAGGFDEQYFMYGEDIDLSFTIKELGYQNYYMGEETVLHFKGESTTKDKVYRKRFYNAMKIFYNKHLKRNMIEGFFVHTGLWYAQKFHHKKGTLEVEKEREPQTYNLISDNALLQETLAMVLKGVVMRNVDYIYNGLTEEVIYDMKTCSYKESISNIQESYGSALTHKFIPKNCTFAVGSNSSEGRGMIINW